MLFSIVSALAASAALVLAQDNTTSNGTMHTIFVGANNTLTFSPANVSIPVGDMVEFVFMSGNHTVTQSNFTDPCTTFVNTSVSDPNLRTMSSGFLPVTNNSDPFPTFTIRVTQAAPIWLFCAHVGHCQKGMVAAINANPDGNKTFADFQKAAMASPASNSSASTTSSSSSSAPSATKSNAALGLSSQGGMATVGVTLFGVGLGLLL